MALEDNPKLVVDGSYLERLASADDVYACVDKDLNKLRRGSVIEFVRPKRSEEIPSGVTYWSLFPDVLAYVCGKSIRGGYVLKPTSGHDAEKIRAILGYNNVEGDIACGFRFKKTNQELVNKPKNM